MKLKNILLSIIAIIFVAILPHSGFIPLPFIYAIPIILFVWLYLKYKGENFTNIGFRIKSFSLKPVLVGMLVGVVFFSFSQLILFPSLEYLIKFDDVDVQLYTQLNGNTVFYIFILIMGWVVGGLYEEIVFHGFIFTRFEKIFKGKHSVLLSFVLTTLVFGLYHLQLGITDAINALIIGAGYHVLSLFYRRNLWYGICCHATYNSCAITILYLGYL